MVPVAPTTCCTFVQRWRCTRDAGSPKPASPMISTHSLSKVQASLGTSVPLAHTCGPPQVSIPLGSTRSAVAPKVDHHNLSPEQRAYLLATSAQHSARCPGTRGAPLVVHGAGGTHHPGDFPSEERVLTRRARPKACKHKPRLSAPTHCQRSRPL